MLLVGLFLGVRGHPRIGENLVHGDRILQVSGKTSRSIFYELLARKTNGDRSAGLNVGFYFTVALQRKVLGLNVCYSLALGKKYIANL